MMNNQAKRGFTLIELLVVVLIIGILASVALPQYNKAVRKARLSEVTTTFNALSKAIDMWVMENGYPANSVSFLGPDKTAALDVSIPCTSESDTVCNTKIGQWGAYCTSENCLIELHTGYNGDGSGGNSGAGAVNSWLGAASFYFPRVPNGEWGMFSFSAGEQTYLPEICRWWVQMYGADRVLNSTGDEPSAICNAYL